MPPRPITRSRRQLPNSVPGSRSFTGRQSDARRNPTPEAPGIVAAQVTASRSVSVDVSRTIAVLACLLATALAFAASASAATKPFDDACAQNSPYASPCVGADKVAEAGATECRKAGAPDDSCVMPAGHDNPAAERAAYATSWVHRAAQEQYRLGDSLPLREAQWLV